MFCKALLISAVCVLCVYAQGPRPNVLGPAPGQVHPIPAGVGLPGAQMKPTMPQTCVPRCKEPDETCVRIAECQGAKCHVCALTRSVRLPSTPVQLPRWPMRQMPQMPQLPQMPQRPMGGFGMPSLQSMSQLPQMSQMSQMPQRPMGGLRMPNMQSMSQLPQMSQRPMGGLGMPNMQSMSQLPQMSQMSQMSQMPQRPMGGLRMSNVPNMASMAAMAGMSPTMGGRRPMQSPFQSRGLTDMINTMFYMDLMGMGVGLGM